MASPISPVVGVRLAAIQKVWIGQGRPAERTNNQATLIIRGTRMCVSNIAMFPPRCENS